MTASKNIYGKVRKEGWGFSVYLSNKEAARAGLKSGDHVRFQVQEVRDRPFQQNEGFEEQVRQA